MADHRVQVDHWAEGLGSRDPAAEDVFALYAPLLASLRSAGHVDQQFSMLVDEAVGVWRRPGFDTFLSVPGLRAPPHSITSYRRPAVLCGGCGAGHPGR